jgi:hypothetical protein
MSDAEDLARRYLHLWQEYLTALMADFGGAAVTRVLDRCLLGADRKSPAA